MRLCVLSKFGNYYFKSKYFRNSFLSHKLKLFEKNVCLMCGQAAGRVHFNVDQNEVKTNSVKPGKLIKSLSFVSTYSLKRSKSFNAADVLAAKALSVSDASELGKFSSPVQDILLRAIEGEISFINSASIRRSERTSSLIYYRRRSHVVGYDTIEIIGRR